MAVDLQDLEARLSGSPNNGELLDLLNAAIELVEYEVGPLTLQTATAETVRVADYLSRLPVANITSATYLGSILTVTVADRRTGLVPGLPVGAVVTYTYGRPGPTALEREVILEVARRAYRGTQQGYRPGYGDTPETGGLPPALLLTRADREDLAATRLYRSNFA